MVVFGAMKFYINASDFPFRTREIPNGPSPSSPVAL